MSKTSYFTKVDGKKVTSTENIVKRHGGKCALVATTRGATAEAYHRIPWDVAFLHWDLCGCGSV